MKNCGMKIFDIFTVSVLLGTAIVLLVTFLTAFCSDMTVLIGINEYGEAIPELVLLIVIVVCGIVTWVRMFRRV